MTATKKAEYVSALGVVVPQWIIAMAKRDNIMDIHMIGDNWRDFVDEDDLMSWNTFTHERRIEIIMTADKKFKDAVNGG